MSWPIPSIRLAVAVICGLALCGCFPSGQSALDEEKEPHFLTGKARNQSMDYKGAIEAFEKALEVNPRSASAHLELGLLYEKDDTDCAAAVYHFNRYLLLRPNAENAGVIRTHILACKQDLAKTVSLGPVTQSMQREFDQLADENRRLRDEVEKWRAWSRYGAGPTNPPSGPGSLARVATVTGGGTPLPTGGSQQSGPGASRPSGGVSTGTRTHKVEAGDTPASLARKYGVKLGALMAANPGLDAKHLQIGQKLNIPSP